MSRSREEIFDIWVPPENIWFRWAIPVLFAQLPYYPEGGWLAALEIPGPPDWVIACDRTHAVVVDLPGLDAVIMGLVLAGQGYRPVPLFNGCDGNHAVVDQQPIMQGLCSGAEWLSSLSIASNAPPAILLDSRRMNGLQPITPGMFDNRWKVFPQDFPSAEFLISQGLTGCLVVLAELAIEDDLCHVLCRWQDAGLTILRKVPTRTNPPAPVEVPRPDAYRSVWYRASELSRFKQNLQGGFGHIVPEPRKG
jgi:hypothetical protein